MTEYNQLIFSGTLAFSNIFRLKLILALTDAWFTQNKFLTELNSPVSGVHFSFATVFQNFNFVQFRLYSKAKFPMDLVYNGENRLLLSFFMFEK